MTDTGVDTTTAGVGIAMTEGDSPGQLVPLASLQAVTLFSPGGSTDVLDRIRQEARAVAAETDISTKQGRAGIASLAYKVARSKTALDEMGANLAADLKKKVGAIDAERRRVREELDALRDEVRKPLTDWEGAENKRVSGHEQALVQINSLHKGMMDASSAVIQALLVESLPRLADRDWQEFAGRADREIAHVRGALTRARDDAAERERTAEAERIRKKEEAEQAQRERDDHLRAEATEKARLVAEAKAAREAAAAKDAADKEQRRVEKERIAAVEAAKLAQRMVEEAEARRIAAERRAENDRIARHERALDEVQAFALPRQSGLHSDKIAERRGRLETYLRGRDWEEFGDRVSHLISDIDAVLAQAQSDALQSEKRIADERAEKERAAVVETERRRVADERERETAKREKLAQDRKHRMKIHVEAAKVLSTFGVSLDVAGKILDAISDGDVPHVMITY